MILNACEKGNYSLVEELLLRPNEKEDINQRSKLNENSPLHLACIGGHVEIVELLLKSKIIDVNQRNFLGLTPLNQLCYNREMSRSILDVTKLLLKDLRVDVNTVSNEGSTPFFNACKNGHLEIFKEMNKMNRVEKDVFTGMDVFGTPLLTACRNGHKEIMEELIIGQNPLEPRGGINAIDAACAGGHAEILKVLLKHVDESEVVPMVGPGWVDNEIYANGIPGDENEDGSFRDDGIIRRRLNEIIGSRNNKRTMKTSTSK